MVSAQEARIREKKWDDPAGGQGGQVAGSWPWVAWSAGISPQTVVIKNAVIAGRMNGRVGTTDSC
jgi:hypothetical protein